MVTKISEEEFARYARLAVKQVLSHHIKCRLMQHGVRLPRGDEHGAATQIMRPWNLASVLAFWKLAKLRPRRPATVYASAHRACVRQIVKRRLVLSQTTAVCIA